MDDNPASSYLYLSQVLGAPIDDVSGNQIGSVRDVILAIHEPEGDESERPRVVGLVGRIGRAEVGIPWSDIAAVNSDEVVLRTETVPNPISMDGKGEVLLARDMLDKQVIDLEHARVVRVNDLQLVCQHDNLYLYGVDVRPQALLRRIVPRRFSRGQVAQTEGILPWPRVEFFSSQTGATNLRLEHEDLDDIHPAELAEMVDEMGYAQGAELLESLDDEQAADTLEEMSPEHQASLIVQMDEERAADILDEMEPDDAADLLADLPNEKADALLARMDADEAEDVTELLQYPEHTAGGIMTNDVVTMPEQMTASAALLELRQREDVPDPLYYIYIVSDMASQRLTGIVSLRKLLLAGPYEKLVDLMERDVPSASPEDDEHEVARTIQKYNLLTLPVVDKTGRILGIVTVDDAIDILVPEDWKKRLPRLWS